MSMTKAEVLRALADHEEDPSKPLPQRRHATWGRDEWVDTRLEKYVIISSEFYAYEWRMPPPKPPPVPPEDLLTWEQAKKLFDGGEAIQLSVSDGLMWHNVDELCGCTWCRRNNIYRRKPKHEPAPFTGRLIPCDGYGYEVR